MVLIQTEDGSGNIKSNMARRGQGLENLRVSPEFGMDPTAQTASPVRTSLMSIREQELMNGSDTVAAFCRETYFPVTERIQANYTKSRKYKRGKANWPQYIGSCFHFFFQMPATSVMVKNISVFPFF